LAHSKSALKRWRQSIEARDRNRAVKSRTRTLLTKALASIGSDVDSAEEDVRAAISAVDKAAQKRIIHANAAARVKSRLLKRLNMAQAGAVASAASGTPATKAPAKKAAPKAAAKTTRPRAKKS